MRAKHLEQLLDFGFRTKMNVLIKGSPGIGKTDIVKKAATAAEHDLLIAHPVVDDPVDYKGLPFEIEGKAEFLPIGQMNKLIEADRPTVFFLDDLGQAAPAVQAACMQLLLGREINGTKISDEITFVAATNRKSDKAGVSGILEPVKSRFGTIVELEVNSDDWTDWAADAGMPSELIAFILHRPNLLNEFTPTSDITNGPCPRTVAQVGKMIKNGLPEHLRPDAIEGAAGEGFASEFLGFLDIAKKLPDPKSVLKDPHKHGLDKIDDVATIYALCVSLSEYIDQDNADQFLEAVEYFDTEYAAVAIRLAMRRNRKILSQNPKFIEWVKDHNETVIVTD